MYPVTLCGYLNALTYLNSAPPGERMYTPVEFALPFALALAVLCVVECICSAFLGLFFSKDTELRQAGKSRFLISVFEFLCSSVFSAGYAAAFLATGLLTVALWATVLLCLGSILYVTYEQAPWVWTDLIRAYNAFLGPFLHGTVVQILELSDLVFRGLVPLWNAAFFFVSRVLQGWLVPTMVQEAAAFKAMGVALFQLALHSTVSLFVWVQSVVVSCPLERGDACFDLNGRTLDLVTPMADLRDGVAALTGFVRGVCSVASPVLDIATYPFMDLNFATGLHKLANAVLFAVVQVPEVTFERCQRHGAEQALMCTPDLDPVFGQLASGVSDLGRMVDNWLNAVYVIVQGVLGWASHACDSVSLAPPFLAGPLRASLFGANRTGVVGLTGWLMAVTDGHAIAYYGRGSGRVAVWPSPVNVSHGLAAVTYAGSSTLDVTSLSAAAYATSTAVFGCSCVSDGDRIQIQCSVVPYEGLLANQSSSVPVLFQDAAASALSCPGVDVVVQSVRWPQTRFAGSVPDCALKATCNQVDATVWVVPRAGCDAESTLCNCHPFCMGVRLAGSQNAPIVLYGATQWRGAVHAIRRDCNLQSTSSGLAGSLTVTSSLAAAGGPTNPVATVQAPGLGGLQYVAGDTISCTDNLLVTSIINRTAHPAYGAPTPAFLRAPLAPFAVTGDTLLTAVPRGDGGYTVRVERLTGATGTEYTLSTVTHTLPAYPPPDVPRALFAQFPKDHLTVPYARQATLAVSSSEYVFYAVNPALQVYDAYLTFCRDSVQLPQFGLIMTSSFSPIRIWRVAAYRRCDQAGCGADLVSQADVPDAFSNGTDDGSGLTWDCARAYNEGVTQLEFVNAANIAVTVRRTDVRASFVEYRVYWLHVDTMRLALEPWPDAVQATTTALGAYTLCPAMQVLPNLGSLGAGLVNAGIFLVKAVVGVVVYLPGIVLLWSSGTVCPLATRGHSVLQQCGGEVFSLDDFFDSLQGATNVFWSSLNMLSASVADLSSSDASRFVQNLLDGSARYGAGSIDLWTASFTVLGVMEAGPSATLEQMPTTLFTQAEGAGSWVQGGYKLASNTLGWARFGYNAVVKVVVTVTQNVLLRQPVGAGRAWRIVVNTLDEMRADFEAYVVDNLRQSCAGVSLMLGLTNPWARFVYHQCIAANTVVSSGVDLTLAVFNLAPFAQCMCSGSAGKVFGDYARLNCLPQASTRLRPVLLQMIQASAVPTGQGQTAAQALCQQMLDYTRTSVVASVQPWFDAQFSGLDAMADSVDYALSWYEAEAGNCLDHNEDPDVVVLMPYPVDYFQACGGTSLCRAKCAGVWDAFEQSLRAPSSFTQTVSVSVESLFFPSMTVDSFNPMRIQAILEPTAALCARVCGGVGGATGGCIAVAGLKAAFVVVQYYCTPALMTASVFRSADPSLEWVFPDSKAWSESLVRLQFADLDGRFLVALTSDGAVRLGCVSRELTLSTLASQTLDVGRPVLSALALQAFSRPPLVSVHVNLLYRVANGQISGAPLHRKAVLDTGAFAAGELGEVLWVNVGADGSLFAALSGYAPSQLASTAFAPTADFVLLPTSDGLPVCRLTAAWDAETANGVVAWSLSCLSEAPAGLGRLLAAGEVLSQNCHADAEGGYVAFAGAPPAQSAAWLSQVRVTGASAAAFHSQSVGVTLRSTTECGVQSCAGCPDGEVQRLCDAVQACAVINCIGTPLNMRRVLCQLGQTIADESRETLAVMHGGWVIFVDVFMSIMDLSLQSGVTGVTLTFPDDSFFGYVCTAKDRYAHLISIFTSALNGAIQVGYSAVAYLEGGAHTIDSNFNALVTMPMTALTSFIYQLFTLPLYGLIVAHKVMMCRVQGVVAVFDVSGFSVVVGDARMQAASDSAVGQCLTANFATQLANPQDSDSAQSTGRIVTQVAQSSALAMLPSLTFRSSSLESIMHMLDGGLSYLMGVVSSLADLLASLDMTHCKMPDYFLNETVFCACGDIPYGVPLPRRREGLAGLGLWCTGTLSLLDAANRPYVVYNPYTYEQLQAYAEGADAYLACMSDKAYVRGQSDCRAPSAPALQAQGVSVLTVLTACKGNYAHLQWDAGAHVLFNRSLFGRAVSGVGYPALDGLPAVFHDVGACLSDSATRPGCLATYLGLLQTQPEVYWAYEGIPEGPSQFIAACQVFTGPATNPLLLPAKRSAFRACLDQYADSNCQLSSNLWTPQSSNAVPVAWRHAVTQRGQAVDALVALKFEEAKGLVMSALERLAGYANANLQTVFFSPEGDIMHQMMDCVFLGPHAKVNYWPPDSQGRLPIPSWFRDEDGTSRRVDPRKCLKGSDKAPPYSCGSAARQAVIKYFFRDYLPAQENNTLGDIVTALAGELLGAWNDTRAYACRCPDAARCCGQGDWLPPGLQVPYQTLTVSKVLSSLTTQLRAFYRHALEEPQVWVKYLDPAALAGYDWTGPTAAAIVTREGLYRTDRPVVRYDASEARAPMLTTALWHQCHGLLGQIFFTLPMQKASQWVPRNAPGSIDGVRALDAFVAEAVAGAFRDSPLYRHYNVSHVPSDSRMCRRAGHKAGGRVKVAPYSAQGTLLLDTAGWPSLPAYGTDAFPVAGCFCGWDGDGGACAPPAAVCGALPDLCPTFAQSPSVLARIKARWSPAWPCPSLALSDHSGALDASEMDDWLLGVARNYSISGGDLLRRGRSGLRAGNFRDLSGAQLSSPAQRTLEPLEAALPHCASDYRESPDLLDPAAHLRLFVSTLFPVGQGVYESGATAHCLRYTVESALLAAMELALPLAPGLGPALAAQRLVSDLWRVRCEGQIALLALCKGLGAFQPPVNPSLRTAPCPFSVSVSGDVYVTPGCLVHRGGRFYDPCNCPGFACGPSKPQFASFVEACRIPFDPRAMVGDDVPLGGWRVSPLEAFDRPAFAESVLGASLGNTPRGGDWARDEGFLNVTGLHCDMMADWWPSDQTLPVGYHATVPCSADETGYRSFDSAFAVERSAGEFTVARLVYQHDLTRAAQSVDAQAGAGGVCRGSNLGAPMVQTNTMQLCTRQQTAPDFLDPAVPAQPAPAPFGQEQCGSDVPWFDPTGGLQDSALYSLGTVPNMPSGATYPDPNRNFGIGPKASILRDLEGGSGWGEGCSDFAVQECAAASDCPAPFLCVQRVCVHADFNPVTGTRCFRNDMCPDGLVCDGTGRCVQGYLYYLNAVADPVEAAVYAEACDDKSANTYYTDGASPWEYVPDWLEGHGMCSNKNWYYYTQGLRNVQECGTCSASACAFDPRACKLPFNASLWWPPLSAVPAKFAVRPTVCDRDYEHLRGPSGLRMAGCSPSPSVDNRVTDAFGNVQTNLAYAGLFRNYADGVATMARMPLSTANRTGFLGYSQEALSATSIVNCETFSNCYAYPFTFRGVPTQRLTWRQGVPAPYADDDIFRCGAAAYYDSVAKKCVLDTGALPLYTALCQSRVLDACACQRDPTDDDPVGCAPVVDRLAVQGLCGNILASYPASYATIQANARNLQALFNTFLRSDGSLRAHLSGVECFAALHAHLQTPVRYGGPAVSLHYPFEFALYEVPLAWVYQCAYLAGVRVDPGATTVVCQNYANGMTLQEARNLPLTQDSSLAFDFDIVRAGYNRSDVLASYRAFKAAVAAALPPIESIAQYKDQCDAMSIATCRMVPYCATKQDWVPNAGMSDLDRRLLAALYATRCGQDVKAVILEQMDTNFTHAIATLTRLKAFLPEDTGPGVNGLPAVVDLINASLQGCVTSTYDEKQLWPFSVLFPADPTALAACLRRTFVNTLNDLSMQLVSDFYMYSDVNAAYMPSQNIQNQRFMSQSSVGQACIFPDLNAERSYYDLPPKTPNCAFQDKTCRGVTCQTYPLTYMTGQQACRYPTPNAYTSLNALMRGVWGELQPGFLQAFARPLTIATPVEQPFFTGHFKGWAYDISGIKAYMSNINPDTSKEIMCVLTSAASAINFTVCNDPNYAALRAFTDSQRHKGAPVVPPGAQLQWRVSAAFLSRGAVFAFANATRKPERVLLRTLFDGDARCGVGEKMANRVCLVRREAGAGTSTTAWVPWLSGQWNPYETCDVRLMDLTRGNQEEIWPYDPLACPDCGTANSDYRTNHMFPSSPACDTKRHTYSKYVNVEPTAPTNLCYLELQDSDPVCTHAQGMVGGGRGQSVLNHPTVPNLYGYHNVSGWPSPGGIYPRGNNPLFAGADAEGYGVLNVPGDELGAAAIGLRVESAPGGLPYLRVAKVPLQPPVGYMAGWASQDAEWLSGVGPAFQAEDALHAKEQAARGSGAWHCPLRRMAFYSNSVAGGFAPAVPSPGRARRLFGNLTGNLSAHPTQRAQRDGSTLGAYLTSNGFCYCPAGMQGPQTQCLIPVTDTQHNCSLHRTIRGLQGEWIQTVAFAPQSPGGFPTPCQMQYDWPYLDGALRDGTPLQGDFAHASDPVGRRCHLLDRLRPFQYRYRQGGPPRATASSTLDPGGVCHTGRAATLTPATASLTTTRCVKQSETDSAIVVSCEDGTGYTLAKEQSTPLDAMVQAAQSKRARCAQCAAPPAFVNSKRQPIPPESSFGIPFRVSASRAAAADLMGAVCEGRNCSFLNQSAWSRDEFMRNLLSAPEALFGLPPPAPPPPPERAQWPAGEWVFCNTTAALQQGACSGRIPEADWRANRFQTCYNEINDLTRDTPDAMASVDVCLMDADLNNLCTAVSQAQTLVRQANCIASGSPECALKPFLYPPASWDVSNREFVHGSVARFYRRVTPDACPSVAAEIVASNQAVLNRCAATPMTAVNLALQACRNIVDAFALVLFYASSILIDGLLLAFSSNRAMLEAQIVYYWTCIIQVVQELVAVLSDIVFDMLFHMGGMGRRIYQFLARTCGLVNTAYGYWLKVWCGIALDLAPPTLGAIRSMAEMSETGFGVLNSALDSIFMAVVPAALSKMQGLGFTTDFRSKQKKAQGESKQEIKDTLKESKKESKSADEFKAKAKQSSVKTALRNVATSDLAKGILAASAYTAVTELASRSPVGSLVVGLGQAIADGIEMNRLLSLYPQNWTLFEFSDIYLALDTLEYYLTTDDMCLTYRQAGAEEILNCTFPSLVGADSLQGAAMVATRCWADAPRDVGTSNLLSCTGSDTCYRSLYDRTPVVCGTCPDAADGYSVFGCSPVTKMCTCAVPVTRATRCTSNQQCAYSGTTCALITGLDDMSYGNQPCADCSRDVQCLVRDASGVGTCGCVYQAQPLQQCSQTPGQMVPITSPASLCGFLVGADRSQLLIALTMDSIALAPCIYLKAASIYCVMVYQGGAATTLAVGLAMAPISGGFGASRRLLMADDSYRIPHEDDGGGLLLEDWNGTAEPCSSLVAIFQAASRQGTPPALGPTDTLKLHSCAYWRLVGRRTVEQYNLTAVRETFLLSSDDFAAALATRWALLHLLRRPEALLFAAAHSPLLRPLYAALLAVRSMAAELGATVRVRRSWRGEGGNGSAQVWAGGEVSDLDSPDAEDPLADDPLADDPLADDPPADDPPADDPPTDAPDEGTCGQGCNGTGRRLLQSNTDIRFAETWLAGPFTWPPPFLTTLSAVRCTAATAMFQIFRDILAVLSQYYSNAYTPPPAPPKRIWDNLPSFTCSDQPTPPAGSWTGAIYHALWGLLGLRPGCVREFFGNGEGTNVFTITTSLFKCNFEGLMFCSQHKKDLFASSVLLVLLLVLVFYVSNAMAVPFLGSLLLMAGVVPLVLWYSYGMALTCLPMVPTCLMRDVLEVLYWVCPYSIVPPAELLVSKDCLDDPTQTSCLRECSAPPMSFVDWRDTFAHGACYLSPSACTALADIVGSWDPLSDRLRQRALLLGTAGPSLVSAWNFCFTVTFVNLVPVLVLLVVVTVLLTVVIYLPCAILPKLLSLVAESVSLIKKE